MTNEAKTLGLIVRGLCLAVAAICCLSAVAQAGKPSAARRAAPLAPAPTRWDQALIDRFLADVPSTLGPRPVAATSSGAKASDSIPDATDQAAATEESSPDSVGKTAWSKVISAGVLEDEIKAVHLSLGESLKTASKFKSGGFRTARQDLSWMAVLLEVVGRYDGEVRWHGFALALRDGAVRAGRNCKAASDATFKEAKQRMAELADLLRGQRPDAVETPGGAPWPELAERPPLMQRLETAQRERLAPWTASEEEFRGHRSQVLHEAQVVALLATVICDAGYEFGNESSYQAEAQALRTAAEQLRQAAENSSLEQAQSALRQAAKCCDDCHTSFRS